MNLTRRSFLSYSLYGGALVLASPVSLAFNPLRNADNAEDTDYKSLTPLLEIHPDNSLVFYYPSPEMGQGVDTSLAMLFVEELGASMDQVTVSPLPYSIERNEEGEIGWQAVPQGAGGSTSISRNWPLLRDAGATTRQLLIQAGSKVFGEPVKDLYTQNGMVLSKSGRSVAFGDLVEVAAKEQLPADFKATLKKPKDWQSIGTKQPGKQVADIVTGKPLFGMDMDYPGAKVALVARSEYLDGYVESFDASRAKKLPGVHAVVELPRPALDKYYTYLAAGVAVVADDFWSAKKARELIDIQWNRGPAPATSTRALNQQSEKLLSQQGQIVRDDGDVEKALDDTEIVVSHTYSLPLVSHAQLEPQNCIAHVTKDNCTIIGPMQSPSGASRLAEAITGLDRVNMDIRYTRLGGGFGRRLNNDHVAEAVTISKLTNLPIKLIWTREDDLSHDFYRPMGRHQLTAGVSTQGDIIAWKHRLAATPKHYRRDGRKPEELYQADIYVDDFPAGLVANLQYEYLRLDTHIPQGSWRAPAHTANAFVVQSFVDEVAAKLQTDPLQLRLQMLGEPKQLEYGQHGGPVFDTGRMANVLKEAARLADWGRVMPKNAGLGIAGHFTFGGYCAQVAEVERLDKGRFKVHKVYCAIDVGTVVNPHGVIAQVEGGINDGLSAALGQQIIFEDGRVITDNFDTYRMLRIRDSVDEIITHIVDSDAPPSGVGEMTLPPLAPAVANAIVAAGGERLRHHPLRQKV